MKKGRPSQCFHSRLIHLRPSNPLRSINGGLDRPTLHPVSANLACSFTRLVGLFATWRWPVIPTCTKDRAGFGNGYEASPSLRRLRFVLSLSSPTNSGISSLADFINGPAAARCVCRPIHHAQDRRLGISPQSTGQEHDAFSPFSGFGFISTVSAWKGWGTFAHWTIAHCHLPTDICPRDSCPLG